MNIESCDIVYASDHEEFYYKDSGLVVEEGEPVGVDVELKDEVKFVLLSNIFLADEEKEIPN